MDLVFLFMFFLKISSSACDAEPNLTLDDCPGTFVPTSGEFGCTCTAHDVGTLPFSIFWKDPEGTTVAQADGTETSVSLNLQSVLPKFNTREYRCELLHELGHRELSYTPRIAEEPSPPFFKDCPESLTFASDAIARCTCMTNSLGRPPALLSWENPRGSTVTLTRSKSLTLLFTMVNQSESGQNHSCVLSQTITGVRKELSYTPELIVKPNDPILLGVQTKYVLNETVSINCSVSGGVPGTKQVDLLCANHADQPDILGNEGLRTSSLVFTAQVADNNTLCTCMGKNTFTGSKKAGFAIHVFENRTTAPDKTDSVTSTSLVIAITAVVSSVCAIVAVSVSIYEVINNKRNNKSDNPIIIPDTNKHVQTDQPAEDNSSCA